MYRDNIICSAVPECVQGSRICMYRGTGIPEYICTWIPQLGTWIPQFGTRIPEYVQGFLNLYRDSRIWTGIQNMCRDSGICTRIPKYTAYREFGNVQVLQNTVRTSIAEYVQGFQNMYRNLEYLQGYQTMYKDFRICIVIPKYVQGYQNLYRDSRICTGIPEYTYEDSRI
jgi:hypothetical protein